MANDMDNFKAVVEEFVSLAKLPMNSEEVYNNLVEAFLYTVMRLLSEKVSVSFRDEVLALAKGKNPGEQLTIIEQLGTEAEQRREMERAMMGTFLTLKTLGERRLEELSGHDQQRLRAFLDTLPSLE